VGKTGFARAAHLFPPQKAYGFSGTPVNWRKTEGLSTICKPALSAGFVFLLGKSCRIPGAILKQITARVENM
jgi:hypothetical protein